MPATNVTANPPAPISTGDGSWYWHSPRPQGNSLRDITCPTTTHCVAVGEYNTILVGDDSGVSWNSYSYNSVILNSFSNVSCPTPQTCFAAGNEQGRTFANPLGLVIKSSDGGHSWKSVFTNKIRYFGSFACANSSFCVLTNDMGLAFSTTDSGASWNQNPSASGETYFGANCQSNVCYLLGKVAVAGGGPVSSQAILKSSDGGQSWTRQTINANPRLDNLTCPALDLCYAPAYNTFTYKYLIYKTDNAGQNGSAQVVPSLDSSTSISCSDRNHCAAGKKGNSNSSVVYTNDGGTSWNVLANGLTAAFNCTNPTFCITATDPSPSIYTSTDGGLSWTDHTVTLTSHPRNLICPSATKCVGATSSSNGIGVSDDGGFTWVFRTPSGAVRGADVMACFDATNCYGVGPSGSTVITKDGGQTWSSTIYSAGGADFKLIGCVSSQSCVVISTADRVFVTNDSGLTYTNTTGNLNTVNGISCPGSNICYVVGAGGVIYKTIDGGNTWTNPNPFGPTLPNYRAITCLDTNSCYIVSDNTIIYTSDGGANWKTLFSEPNSKISLGSISCAAASKCTVVGSPNLALFTLDGGKSWYKQYPGTATLDSVSCLPTRACIALTTSPVAKGILVQYPPLPPLIVTAPSDDGSANSLSEIIKIAKSGQTILLDVPGNKITLGANPVILPYGVSLKAKSCAIPTVLDANHLANASLILQGKNTLEGLSLINIKNSGIKATGNGNHLTCVKSQA